MPNDIKADFLNELKRRFGSIEKFGDSLSLFRIGNSDIRIYVRYSKLHPGGRGWYGLRQKDLQLLEGFPSLVCFLWDNQNEPLFVPLSDYEEIFQSSTPAEDGQYKVQIIPGEGGTDFYIARAGHFNVDGFFGWEQIEKIIDLGHKPIPELSHSQVQTMLGSIGSSKSFDIWVPPVDRSRLDWTISSQYGLRESLPYGFEKIEDVIGEVDVIWLMKGSNEISALFEVEHSTPIYSGLLRFNDIHLAAPHLKAKFSIVANNERRSRFARQLNRPTFQASGLGDLCTFFEYSDVYNWHRRISVR